MFYSLFLTCEWLTHLLRQPFLAALVRQALGVLRLALTFCEIKIRAKAGVTKAGALAGLAHFCEIGPWALVFQDKGELLRIYLMR